MKKRVFLHSDEIEGLSYPPDCPFNTKRAPRTLDLLSALSLLNGSDRGVLPPRRASRQELEAFHRPQYLDELERASSGELTVEGLHMGLGTPDTPVFPDLLTYGQWACGASLTAADLILHEGSRIVFNPWGGFHHARTDKAAGFCYVNDVVLACQRLAAAGKRVLFLDIDAHHGDGVQEAFYERSDVLTVSVHESGHTLFPWGGFENELGEGEGSGYCVNVPVPAETYDDAYLRIVRRVVYPVLDWYDPDVVVLELGMDALAGDPLTHLTLTNNAYASVVERVVRQDKPVLATGGGGYNIENTVRGWALAWKTLCEEPDDDLSIGMGGVMLESTEWLGGLKDRELPVQESQRQRVLAEMERTFHRLSEGLSRLHGLDLGTF